MKKLFHGARNLLKPKYIILAILIISLGLNGVLLYSQYNYLSFKTLMTKHYLYEDAMSELYTTHLKVKDPGEDQSKYFDFLLMKLLADELHKINYDKYTYLYTPGMYRYQKEYDVIEGNESSVEILNKDTVYLKLTNFTKTTEEFINDKKDTLKGYPYIIIDLRNNRGGDIFFLHDLLDLFLDSGKLLASHRTRSPLFSLNIRSHSKQYLDFEEIVILQNGSTASASEGLIAGLRDHLDNVTLIGDTTFGKGIGQFTLPLKDGFAFKATTMYWTTPKGTVINRIGINPDIYLDEDVDHIERAQEYLDTKR